MEKYCENCGQMKEDIKTFNIMDLVWNQIIHIEICKDCEKKDKYNKLMPYQSID